MSSRQTLAVLCAAGLCQAAALAQSSLTQTESWIDRLRANDPKVRATAEAALVQRAPGSFPLLKRLLDAPQEDLHVVTFHIIQRIGPPAIPLLAELLRHESYEIRRSAVDELIDLAPQTESIQPALRRALSDEDSTVAGDAARALGALGTRASPSVGALVKTLSHEDPYVRIYAAEALASIGPNAVTATHALADALGDPVPGVRWAACEALGSFGPAAQSAVPRLIEALNDEFLYVRIFAAGALGSIGPKAQPAREALRAAANDPALRSEAEWALRRIAGVTSGEPAASDAAPAPSVASPAHATSVPTGNAPVDWDSATGRNIVWNVALGHETYGRPVIAGDTVYVGTGQDDAGVLMAFQAKDGKFLWRDVAPRVERGLREFLLPSTTSAPYVEGNRLYYVTAECQLRCLDTHGSRIWELDICGRLGVFPHEATNSDVLPVGDLLIVSTSNGQNEGHTRVPSPRAPSVIAVDKRSGDVVWRAIGAGADVLHGQWSSPVAANVNGRMQVLFGGGDGWLRSYDAASGHELWRFDGNPKDAPWRPRPGVFSRGPIIASPVFADGRVFIAMGQSPGHGNGPSLIHAISPNGQGDVTASRLLWTSHDVGRVVGTPIAKDGLLYVGDLGGTIHCLDAASGALVWKHETNEAIWGSLLLAGDRLYVGNAAGTMTILRTGRRKEVLGEIEMDAAIYSPPAVAGDTLYLATAKRLYRIAAGQAAGSRLTIRVSTAALTDAEVSSRELLPTPGITARAGVASPTRAPWIVANGWRFVRQPGAKWRYDVPAGKAALAAAEAFAYGADALLKIDPADEPGAGAMLTFLEGLPPADLPAIADLAVVEDGTAATGEVMNLLARRNLLYEIVKAPSPRHRITIAVGSREFPVDEAADPSAFALKIRRLLTDEQRTLRVYGSEVVIARLVGDDTRIRLHVINYAGREIDGLRIRLRGAYVTGDAAVAGVGRVVLQDFVTADGATEFTLPRIGPYAVIDLERTR